MCALWLSFLGGPVILYATADNTLTFTSSNGTSISSIQDQTSVTVAPDVSTNSQSNPALITGSPIAITAYITDISNPSASVIGIVSWSDNHAGGIFNPDNCLLVNNKCAITYTPPSNLTNNVTITATYDGDSSHSGSHGTTLLSIPVSSSTSQSNITTPANNVPNPSPTLQTNTSSNPPVTSQTPTITAKSNSNQSVSTTSSVPIHSMTNNTPSTPPSSTLQSNASTSSNTQPIQTNIKSSQSAPSVSLPQNQSKPTITTASPSAQINPIMSQSKSNQTVLTVNQVVNAPETIFDKIISMIESLVKKI